jgi:hypothetical protein
MANATANRDRYVIGKEGRDVFLPVAASVHLYAQTMVLQFGSGGTNPGHVVKHGTANADLHVIGVTQHEVDNSSGAAGAKRVTVERDREFVFDNDTTNPCSEAVLQGAKVYAVDDHTIGTSSVTNTLPVAGTFCGMEPNGKVRVMIHIDNVLK